MANTKSAKKAARQTLRRTEVNKARKSRVRGFLRKAEDALKAGDKSAAAAAVRAAEPELMKAAQNGILHSNAASRKVSRLDAALKKLQG